jgi:hypothetical protein
MKTRFVVAVVVFSLLGSPVVGAEEMAVTVADLWEVIQRQQAEIVALQNEVRAIREDAAVTDQKVAVAAEQIEATGEFVESFAVAAPSRQDTSIGGYGELHYNNIDAANGDSEEIDFHRFVLFFGHQFSDRVQFFSEFELEHSLASSDGPGEVELEQAYVDIALRDNLAARAGLFLVPVGIINETHEPPTFYGVERNDVENIIMPATWWEAGAGLSGHFDNGISWDVAMHSGLAMPTDGGSAFRVRSGRQKVAEALASDPAYTARLKYSGLPGLELAASYQYQSDPSQVAGDGLDRGQLFTAHASWQRGGFGLRALYGGWKFDGAAVEAADADRQDGWYVEPSYRLTDKWGVYARYEDLDGARTRDQFTQNEFGINFWPTDGVVFKVDYRDRDHTSADERGRDFSAIDLGFGYAF